MADMVGVSSKGVAKLHKSRYIARAVKGHKQIRPRRPSFPKPLYRRLKNQYMDRKFAEYNFRLPRILVTYGSIPQIIELIDKKVTKLGKKHKSKKAQRFILSLIPEDAKTRKIAYRSKTVFLKKALNKLGKPLGVKRYKIEMEKMIISTIYAARSEADKQYLLNDIREKLYALFNNELSSGTTFDDFSNDRKFITDNLNVTFATFVTVQQRELQF